jgi:hypothetical protein
MAKRFHLERDEDATGISGTGRIAEGVEFETGMAAMAWLTEWHSVAIYPNMEHVERIHGHNGKTRIVWDDGE